MKRLLYTIILCFVSGTTLIAQTLPAGFSLIMPVGNKIRVDNGPQEARGLDYVLAGSASAGYHLFFVSKNDVFGEELWISDGTTAGTHSLKDIYPGPDNSGIKWITRFNDKVVFQALQDTATGYEPWISDGTTSGTHMIKNIRPVNSSKPSGFMQINETQFIFGAKDCESTNEGTMGQSWLWISDGTDANTQILKDCSYIPYGIPATSYGQNAVRVGRQIYFRGQDRKEETGMELWVTDGTTAGTQLVKDINSGVNASTNEANASNPSWMMNVNNRNLFFMAGDNQTGGSAWTSTGAGEPTLITKSTYANDSVSNPIVYKDKVFYRGYAGPAKGIEPYLYDVRTNTGSLFADINPGVAGSNFEGLAVFDGVLMYKAVSGSKTSLYYTDSIAQHITQPPGSTAIALDDQSEGIVASGSFYFTTSDGLYRMDTKSDIPLKIFTYAASNRVYALKNMTGDLYFVMNNLGGLYKYSYRKPGYSPEKDSENMEINFVTKVPSVRYTAENTGIRVFPNPATEILRIESTNGITGIKIYDNCGRMVISCTGNEQTVNIKSIPSGFYHIRAFGSTGVSTATFIKK